MNLRTALATGALAAVAAGTAKAQSVGWTLCGNGAFRSCHSIQLTTSAIMSGSVRTGTMVTITLRNLQGTHGSDNTAWSVLQEAVFRGTPTPIAVPTAAFVPGMSSGAASGSGIASYFDGTVSGTNAYTQAGMNFGQTGGAGIRGCAASPHPSNFATCGGSVSFTYASSSVFDATQIHSALIGFRSSNDPLNDERCVTDTQLYDTGRSSIGRCGIVTPLPTAVVPEPVTVALLGTGLLGVGAARWRRRREPEA